MDRQTLYGKGPIGVAEWSKSFGIPVIALAGWIEDDVREELKEKGITFIYPLLRKPQSLDEAISGTKESLYQAGLEIGFLLKALQKTDE